MMSGHAVFAVDGEELDTPPRARRCSCATGCGRAQDAALRLAQKSSTVDIPTKVLDLDSQAARERYTGSYGAPDKSRGIGSEATQALAALNRIRRARV